MMHDPRRGDDARFDAALDALQHTPDVSRDRVAVVAARAVLANAPAARTRRTLLRAAALIAVAGVGSLLVLRPGPSRAEMAAAPAKPSAVSTMPAVPAVPVLATAARPIVFELDAPEAHSVQVLGDFNGWSRDADGMQRDADGRWRLTTLLPPGRYVYAYLVDGTRFVRDPVRDAVEDRDFGVTGSELVIGEAP